MLSAKPSHIKGLGVVVMMSIRFFRSANFTSTSFYLTVSYCISKHVPCSCLFWVEPPMLEKRFAMRFLTGCALGVFFSCCGSVWLISPFSVVFTVVFKICRSVLSDIFFIAFLAFIKMPIFHLRMLVETGKRFPYPAFKALFHVFAPYLLLAGHLNMKLERQSTKRNFVVQLFIVDHRSLYWRHRS